MPGPYWLQTNIFAHQRASEQVLTGENKVFIFLGSPRHDKGPLYNTLKEKLHNDTLCWQM
jgi:hypothetical protein